MKVNRRRLVAGATGKGAAGLSSAYGKSRPRGRMSRNADAMRGRTERLIPLETGASPGGS